MATKTKWGVQLTSTRKRFPVPTMRRGARHRLSSLTPSVELHFCESASVDARSHNVSKQETCVARSDRARLEDLTFTTESHGRSFTLQLPAPQCRRSRPSPAITWETRPFSMRYLGRIQLAEARRGQPTPHPPLPTSLTASHVELSAELSSWHRPPPVHETPNLGAQSSRQQLNRTV